MNSVAFACFFPIRILDWLRVSSFGRFLVRINLVRDRSRSDVDVESVFAGDSALRREARVKAKMDDANMTWTMSMAFYALSGGCVYSSKTGEQRILQKEAIAYLAVHEPQSLLQLQRVVLQNPGKANAIGKAITCVQAIWFCSQCVARLNGSFSVSLLELNTFAHCISTLLIYIFWWNKPYDVEIHTFVESKSLELFFLLQNNRLNNYWITPRLRVPHGCYINRIPDFISDSHGNRLFHGSTLITFLPKDANDDLRVDLGSKDSIMRIFDTEFYVSFRYPDCPCGPTYLTDPVYTAARDDWRIFWSAWVESGRPLPPNPIDRAEEWFYEHTAGSDNLDADLVRQFDTARFSLPMSVIMTLTFIVYGGLHLLAWQYNFNSNAERYLWRIGAVTTASTGLVLLTRYLATCSMASYIRTPKPLRVSSRTAQLRSLRSRSVHWIFSVLHLFSYILVVLNIASRAFLVIESFIALPNSPRSKYTIPSWTAYIPHI